MALEFIILWSRESVCKIFENKAQELWYSCSIWWLQRSIVNKSTWEVAKWSDIVCRHKHKCINASYLHKRICFVKYSQQDRVDQNSSAEVYINWHWKWMSVGDTDLLTVKKVLEMAKHHQTTVTSDNTDIFVLLMYHKCSTIKRIVFTTTKSVNKKKVHVGYSVRDLVKKQPLTSHVVCSCLNRLRHYLNSAIQNQQKLQILQQFKSF